MRKAATRRPEAVPEPIRPQHQRAPAPVTPSSALASKAGDQGALGSRRSDNKQRETGLQQQAGGAPDGAAFDLLVRQHLLAHKQTPRLLGGRRSGTVVVEFVIDRQGRLLRQLMGKTSGIREFDHAPAPWCSMPPLIPVRRWSCHGKRVVTGSRSSTKVVRARVWLQLAGPDWPTA
ncbi:MAG: hypothetical protein LRY38_02485 [Aeromonadaceae bacterium]|nr:hypothetical protein [Aeromonadaceae bacterium]